MSFYRPPVNYRLADSFNPFLTKTIVGKSNKFIFQSIRLGDITVGVRIPNQLGFWTGSFRWDASAFRIWTVVRISNAK